MFTVRVMAFAARLMKLQFLVGNEPFKIVHPSPPLARFTDIRECISEPVPSLFRRRNRTENSNCHHPKKFMPGELRNRVDFNHDIDGRYRFRIFSIKFPHLIDSDLDGRQPLVTTVWQGNLKPITSTGMDGAENLQDPLLNVQFPLRPEPSSSFQFKEPHIGLIWHPALQFRGLILSFNSHIETVVILVISFRQACGQ